MANLPIYIGLGELVEEFSLSQEDAQELQSNIIDSIIVDVEFKWRDLVNQGLKGTRSDYLRAIYIERNAFNEVTFGLSADKENPLPIMIEEGSPAFDEKTGFSQSSKKKIKKKGGWFLTIPFRHATPGAIAESGIFSSVMPKEIHKIAKESNRPLKINDLPPQYQIKGVRGEITGINQTFASYTHKSAQYEGLVKKDISSGKEKRNGYFTFRRVSDKSNPLSWIHPGFTPRKFMDKAIEQAQLGNIVDNELEKILKK